jgi:hypothetical protein
VGFFYSFNDHVQRKARLTKPRIPEKLDGGVFRCNTLLGWWGWPFGFRVARYRRISGEASKLETLDGSEETRIR